MFKWNIYTVRLGGHSKLLFNTQCGVKLYRNTNSRVISYLYFDLLTLSTN